MFFRVVPALAILMSLTFFGCGDDAPTTPDARPPLPDATAPMPDATAPTPDATPDAMPMAMGCPGEVEIAFDTDVMGTTEGAPFMDDVTGWLDNSDVSCTPSTMDYPAPYAIYSLPLPEESDWDITVTPARGRPGVDVSVVTWLQSATDASCYPTRGAGVLSCEVANREGPASAETVRQISTTNPYRLMIMVTTPPGAAPRGNFTLRVSNHGG